jgi:hypothetical protein
VGFPVKKGFEVQSSDKFNNLLLRVIDETLRYTLGDINTHIIFDYVEKRYCPFSEVPTHLQILSEALRDLLGSGRGQILGAASILERTIAETFCRKLGMEFDEREFTVFANYIEKLRKVCGSGEVVMLEQ